MQLDLYTIVSAGAFLFLIAQPHEIPVEIQENPPSAPPGQANNQLTALSTRPPPAEMTTQTEPERKI